MFFSAFGLNRESNCYQVSLHKALITYCRSTPPALQLRSFHSFFQGCVEFLHYVPISLLLCPLKHQWNHGCLTCSSLSNSCILFRLQLQKRERSCRFYVQVFATDSLFFFFIYFFPLTPCHQLLHCCNHSARHTFPILASSSVKELPHRSKLKCFRVKRSIFFIFLQLVSCHCYFHQHLRVALSALHAGNLVCVSMRPRSSFAF